MSCKCDTINIVNDNNVIVVSHADGRDGKSAYQQAVEGGYTGTEQEFNCSLSLLADVKQVKENLVSAIEYKGGTSNADKSFQGIAGDIKKIPNFNTNGCEYINEVYKPTTLLEAYYNRYYLKSVIDNYVEEISGANTFASCGSLHNVQFPNLTTINGANTFGSCGSLHNVQFPNLTTINGANTFTRCGLLQNVQFPNLTTINGEGTFQYCQSLQNVQFPNLTTINAHDTFQDCGSLQTAEFPQLTNYPSNFFRSSEPLNITLGVLINISSTQYTNLRKARNIKIGQGTNINLPLYFWTAINVINEGQSGIDELNENLYNNLLTKLYDHSEDGQTRTLRLGWLAHVTQENIDYANSKGWTLTT